MDQAVALLGDHKPGGPLRGGKGSEFEAGTRVPFIVRWPKQVKPGVSDALVAQIDLPASFAALTNQNVPFQDSENILPALLGETQSGRKYLVLGGGGRSLRYEQWKTIMPNNGQPISANLKIETGNSPNPQLYRLDTDLGEQNNLAAVEQERWERMRTVLQEIRNAKTQ